MSMLGIDFAMWSVGTRIICIHVLLLCTGFDTYL